MISRSLCGKDGDEGEPLPAVVPPCAAPDGVHNAGRLWKCLPRPPYPGGVPRLLELRVDAARTVDAEAYIRNRHAENRARHDGLRARAAASAQRGLRPVKDDPRSPAGDGDACRRLI